MLVLFLTPSCRGAGESLACCQPWPFLSTPMPAPICKYTVLFSKHKSQHLIVWYLTTDYSHLNYVGDFSKSQHSVFVCVYVYMYVWVCVHGVCSWGLEVDVVFSSITLLLFLKTQNQLIWTSYPASPDTLLSLVPSAGNSGAQPAFLGLDWKHSVH